MRNYLGVVFSNDGDNIMPTLAHILAFLALAFSSILIFGFQKKSNKKYSTNNPLLSQGDSLKNESIDRAICYFFVLIGCLSIFLTFWMFGRVPLFYAMSGLLGDNGISMHQARQMNTLNHASGDTVYFGQGYLRLIYTVVSPFFLLMMYLRLSISPQKKTSVGKIKVLIYVFVFAAALNGQIWVPLQVSILVFIFFVYALNQKGDVGSAASYKTIKYVIYAYCIAISFIFLYRYLQFIGGRSMGGEIVYSTLNRIFSYPASALFEIFPDREDFRYGSTWTNNLRGILPGSVQSFSYEVHHLIHGGKWGYTLSPGLVASSYVNFGLPGVFFTTLIISLIFSGTFIYLINKRSYFKKSLALFLSFSFAMSFDSDLSSFVVDLLTAALIFFAYFSIKSFLLLWRTKSNAFLDKGK